MCYSSSVAPLSLFVSFVLPAASQELPKDARFTAFQTAADAANDSADAVLNLAVPDGYVAAPWYPTPHGGWARDWADSYARAADLVANMTLAEKTNITTGTGYFMDRCTGNTGSAPRVGFPQLCLQDGPLGVRNTEGVTAFPAGITTGATWNKELMYLRGVAIGQEFRGKGANVHLGPSVGPLGRKPRGGRNWEGFGSDPVLQGIAAAETIKGIQEQGVIATVKHWLMNEQEMFRMYNPFQPGYSSNVDDRTIHELYMWPFADAIRAGCGSVMSAYNAVNGSAATQNSYLINNLLKDELGFQGFMMSDWFAQISGVATALSGLDMSMPGDPTLPLFGNSWWGFHLTEAVLNGSVPVDRLNDMATRIVATWYQMGQDQDYPEPNFSSWTNDAEGPLHPGALISPRGVVNEFVDVQGDHAAVARKVATEAITLLKNNGTLPLDANATLAVFGSAAIQNPDGPNSCADKGCNKGTLGQGWGSGTADYPYLDDPISALRRRTSDISEHLTDSFPGNLDASEDVALVFVTAASGENYVTVEGNPGDRTVSGLNLWHNGDELIKKAAEAYDNVVVIVQTVGPILMEEWADLPSVKAILFQHLPGQEAGESLTTNLYGDESPSGHLPYSITHRESDLPDSVDLVYFQLGQPQDTYSERQYIEYRHLNAHNITPRYPFGHGLSYTTFSLSAATLTQHTPLTFLPPSPPARTVPPPTYPTTIPPPTETYSSAGFARVWRYIYSFLSVSDAEAAHAIGVSNSSSYPYPEGYSATQRPSPVPGAGAPGGNPALWDPVFSVNVTVSNVGERPGKAVLQAYVQFPEAEEKGWETPVLQLRDFVKTGTLQVGGVEEVRLEITRRDVSVWDTREQQWVVPVPEGGYRVWVGWSVGDMRVVCESGVRDGECRNVERGPVA